MHNSPFRKINRALIITLLSLLVTCFAYGWGFWAHKRINKMACFTLPSQLFTFYKNHIDFITEHAVDPDRRRYADPEEAQRHYIDLDRYLLADDFDSIPKFWKDAVAKYGEDTLKSWGIVPWHINRMSYRLTEAFKANDADRILYYSAAIGHYIADAHVPLHCTENYNGQMTNQIGIHAFWESRLPELFGEEYDYFAGQALYIEKPQFEAWKIVRQSFDAKDSVLSFEHILNSKFPPDKKYAFERRGTVTMKVYSEDYSSAYNKMLAGMIERRMRSAIIEIGSFWYTAWVNAGSPDMRKIDNKEISDSLKLKLKEERDLWEKGKLKPKGHDENVPK